MVCFSSILYLSSPLPCREQRKPWVHVLLTGTAVSRTLAPDPWENSKALLAWVWMLMDYVEKSTIAPSLPPMFTARRLFPCRGCSYRDEPSLSPCPAAHRKRCLLVHLCPAAPTLCYSMSQIPSWELQFLHRRAQSTWPQLSVSVCLPHSGPTLELCAGRRLCPL